MSDPRPPLPPSTAETVARRRPPTVAAGAPGEDLLRKVFGHSDDAVVVIDPIDDRIIAANPATIDVLGWTAAEIIGAVGARAISQRRAAEAAPRRLQRKERLAALGEFATTMAHEVRSPLSTIAVALDYLGSVVRTDNARKRLDLAISEVERIDRLMSELLLFARPQRLSRRELRLTGVIEESLGVLGGIPSTEAREIHFTPPSSDVTLSADKDKLKQVLINLLTNACQATGPGQTVTINVVEPAGESVIVIEVINPGTIAADILGRVTEPFFTTKPQGSGLGLAIVERIVRAHGGELSIRCDDGLDVVVRVSLPAVRRL